MHFQNGMSGSCSHWASTTPITSDAYYGPAEWRTEAQHAKVPLAEIEAAATDLAGDLKTITPAASEVGLPRLRHSFVARQLESLRARVSMLQGRKFRFDEGVAGALRLGGADAPRGGSSWAHSHCSSSGCLVPAPLAERYEMFGRGS
jgi:hypothetical protein